MKKILVIVAANFLFASHLSSQIVDNSDKFLGCMLKHEKRIDTDFETYFNQVTPENSGKWDRVELERDVMDWSYLDTLYNYSKENEFPFKQHTFIWDLSQPEWLSDLSLAEQKEEVEEWIQTFCERYPDVTMIEPVNEATRNPPPYKEALGGDGVTGYDWVIWGFEKARQYAPDATLILNDYDVLKFESVRDEVITIANLLKDRGLVDAIGCQAHFLEGQSADQIQDALDQLAATGLDIYITELDIHIANDQSQLNKYEEIFPVMWQHSAVKGITLWGYKEGSMWRSDGYLLREDGSQRPAMTWLQDYLAGNFKSAYHEQSIPGIIEAENYDEGGQYISYFDRDAGNSGGAYRTDAVDVTSTSDGYALTNMEDGEWLYYTLHQVLAGTYDIHFRVSSDVTTANRSVKALLNGEVLGNVEPVNTSGLENWETLTLQNITISPGGEDQVLRLEIKEGDFHLDYVEFTPTASTTYSLTVNNGEGSGQFTEGSTVTVVANDPLNGKVFDQWTGDANFLEDPLSARTIVNMPGANVTISATFKDEPSYSLTITEGSGGGSYTEGTEIEIEANDPPSGLNFDRWAGDIEHVADPLSNTTVVTMPARDISLEALFSEKINVSLQPLDDSFARSDSPDDTKGISDINELNLRWRDPDGSNESIRYTYLKFDLPALTEESFIISAELSLYGYNYNLSDAVDLEILLAENEWDEATLTWNNRPAFDESQGVVDFAYPLLNGGFGQFGIDVTSLVSDLAGETVTIAIRIKNHVNDELIKFASKEATSDPAPELILSIDGDVDSEVFAPSSEPEIIVYPNPISTNLMIEADAPLKKLSVYDVAGMLIKERTVILEKGETLELSSLKPGIYLLKVFLNDDSNRIFKIIKE
jgi:endo-1,4-beta-xylanase